MAAAAVTATAVAIAPPALERPHPHQRGAPRRLRLGEQAAFGQPDPDEHHGDRELVGDVLEMVADLHPAGGVHAEKMQIIDHQKPGLTRGHTVQGATGQVGAGAASVSGVGVELEHRPVELLEPGVAGQPDPAHRPPLVAIAGVGALDPDLAAVKILGERQDRCRLAQAGVGVDRDRALGLVAELEVAVDHGRELLVQRGQLRCPDRAQIGVPQLPKMVVDLGVVRGERPQLPGQHLRRDQGRGVGELAPPLLAGERHVAQRRQVLQVLPDQGDRHRYSSASA